MDSRFSSSRFGEFEFRSECARRGRGRARTGNGFDGAFINHAQWLCGYVNAVESRDGK